MQDKPQSKGRYFGMTRNQLAVLIVFGVTIVVLPNPP